MKDQKYYDVITAVANKDSKSATDLLSSIIDAKTENLVRQKVQGMIGAGEFSFMNTATDS